MYAVIKTGGKQYKVAANDEITVEKIDANEGDEHAFSEVLMLGEGDDVTVGAPVVEGAAVVGEVVSQGKGDKVIIFKKRQRSTYKRKKGHRQNLTTIKIKEIVAEGFDGKVKKAAAKPAKKAAPKAEEAPKAEAKAEAPKKAAPAKAAAEADDLTQLKGVGPKLEGVLNDLGFFHFDQVASWGAEEIAWVDTRLKFKGRIERDGWVEQAKVLAEGGETDFSKRVAKGDVPSSKNEG